MVFLSIEFVIAFIVLLLAIHFIKNSKVQQVIVLIFSYIFYVWVDKHFLLLLIVESVLVYAGGLFIEKFEKYKKAILILCLSTLLLVLGVFKYYNFFVESICSLFNIQNAYSLNLLIPLGISFFTFQAISMLADVYRKDVAAEKSFVKVALSIGIFTQITSGPIMQAKKMLPQLNKVLRIEQRNLFYGLQLIVAGIIKKKVVADRLAVAVEAVFATPEVYSGATLLFTACTYLIQLYMDFSGYSDMAIGLAKMLGSDIGPNFNMPFLAKNTGEFWRRWHISLSTWFKDYVYIPLGGSRKGLLRNCINLFLVMLLSGLWHGASWNFVLWGALFGLCNVLQKLFSLTKSKYSLQAKSDIVQQITGVLSTILCFVVTALIFVFFRADTLMTACAFLRRIFIWATGVQYFYAYAIIFGILLFAIEIWKYVHNNGEYYFKVLDLSRFQNKLIICVLVWLIICFAYVGGNAFVYAQF